MNQNEKRLFLIRRLLQEQPGYRKIQIPVDTDGQKSMLRALMNLRRPDTIDDDFLRVQDEYLLRVNAEKGVVTLSDMEELQPDVYLWKGDITRLKVGAIVNAANSGMTGCYQPCHNCIDNCIHTYAGVQLRLKCAEIMEQQGYEEPAGQAKITPAYNLPCDYVIHTVGPIVQGKLTKKHEELLVSCYRSCLEIADANKVDSVAFCCISTGVFMFPNERAAEIAVSTIKEYKEKTGSSIQVIFNVFKALDDKIYRGLLR
ncbi:MAG: protein-ADP-ribose hydrolase [Clostridium sp.]|nr:protein-ADP-ribose hydrolase [Clostridium sp.]